MLIQNNYFHWLRRISNYLLLLILIISTVPIAFADVTLFADKTVYYSGDNLLVLGNALPDSAVTIQVFNPIGELVNVAQASTDENGAFIISDVLVWPLTETTRFPFGTYRIVATDAGDSDSTEIIVIFLELLVINPTNTTITSTTTSTTTLTITLNRTSTITLNTTLTSTLRINSISTLTSTSTITQISTRTLPEVTTTKTEKVTSSTTLSSTITRTIISTEQEPSPFSPFSYDGVLIASVLFVVGIFITIGLKMRRVVLRDN